MSILHMAGYGSASPAWDNPPRARVAQLAGLLSILLATLVVMSNAGESMHPQALSPWVVSPFRWGKTEMSLSEKLQALRAANDRQSRVKQELAFGNPLVYGGDAHHRNAQDAATAAAAVAAAAAARVKKTNAENAANAAEPEHAPGFVIATTDDSPPVSKSAISHTIKLFEGPPEKSVSTAHQGASKVAKLKEENQKLEEESAKLTAESETLGRAKGTAPINFEHVNKPPLVKGSKLDEAKKLIEQTDTRFPVQIHNVQDSHDKDRTEDALREQHLAKEHAQVLAPAEEARPEQAEVKKDETNIGSPFGLLKRGWEFIMHLDKELAEIVAKYGSATYAILWGIVFTESAFVIFPFLPGDSLLFACGALAGMKVLDLPMVAAAFITAAILGGFLNFWIGSKVGPLAFQMDSWFLKKEYLVKTEKFYEKHGGKSIVLARFVPIIRGFAPFLAGVGSMKFSDFALYNIGGAFLWILLLVGAGFFFGNIPIVQHNFSLAILGIIIISVLPIVYEIWQARMEGESQEGERQQAPSNSRTWWRGASDRVVESGRV